MPGSQLAEPMPDLTPRPGSITASLLDLSRIQAELCQHQPNQITPDPQIASGGMICRFRRLVPYNLADHAGWSRPTHGQPLRTRCLTDHARHYNRCDRTMVYEAESRAGGLAVSISIKANQGRIASRLRWAYRRIQCLNGCFVRPATCPLRAPR